MTNQSLIINGIILIIVSIVSTLSMINAYKEDLFEKTKSTETNYFRTINFNYRIPVNIFLFIMGGILIYHGLAPKYDWPVLWGF